jgi:DNA-binding response OmpR family regulator
MSPLATPHMGKRVLLVEDEMIVSMMLEDALVESGYQVRKAASVRKAMEWVHAESFDAAVLDINLGGECVFPVAKALRERHVPFLFSSGYGEQSIPSEYHTCTVLQKPYALKHLLSAARELLTNGNSHL